VKCAEIIAQKDILIKELRKELKLADERFGTDQKKQKEDLRILAERVDNQIKVMRNAYKDELKLTEVKKIKKKCVLFSGLVNF
jgi:dynein regulatory complex protein 1